MPEQQTESKKSDSFIVAVNNAMDEADALATKVSNQYFDGAQLSIVCLAIHMLAAKCRDTDPHTFNMTETMVTESIALNSENGLKDKVLEAFRAAVKEKRENEKGAPTDAPQPN
jgi:hypothetical protein